VLAHVNALLTHCLGQIRPASCFGLAPGVCSGSNIQFVTMANCTLSRAVGGGMHRYRWWYIFSYSDIYGQKTFACKYFLKQLISYYLATLLLVETTCDQAKFVGIVYFDEYASAASMEFALYVSIELT